MFWTFELQIFYFTNFDFLTFAIFVKMQKIINVKIKIRKTTKFVIQTSKKFKICVAKTTFFHFLQTDNACQDSSVLGFMIHARSSHVSRSVVLGPFFRLSTSTFSSFVLDAIRGATLTARSICARIARGLVPGRSFHRDTSSKIAVFSSPRLGKSGSFAVSSVDGSFPILAKRPTVCE